ncbi:hypothetical protein H2198_002050 [Neophaeococcomyces mojaviensis]|uniref:Uncharacterized protein n=1 Tax=Neophaeococcomyces mojaviensis TaxID=3383035 RepID=A0ACC3AFA9_9EURO|nr:hypothetical protein H2198_002050 [Knufia sp. JES_112]
MGTLKRSSLGQEASLGALYDARTDAFLAESLIHGQTPIDAVASTLLDQTKTSISSSASLKEKFEKLGMSNDLLTSFLAGMIETRGS